MTDRQQLLDEIDDLKRRSDERLVFANAINRFSDISYFKTIISVLKRAHTELQRDVKAIERKMK